MTIVNDDTRVTNKLEVSLTDDARVVIYDHHIFIVQATGVFVLTCLLCLVEQVRFEENLICSGKIGSDSQI
jgi:hypothetical protein